MAGFMLLETEKERKERKKRAARAGRQIVVMNLALATLIFLSCLMVFLVGLNPAIALPIAVAVSILIAYIVAGAWKYPE